MKEQKNTDWHTIKFGDVAKQCKESVDRDKNSFDFYVEGGHMDTENLRLERWGVFGDDYVGPAFHRIFRKGQILYGSRRTYLKKVAIADFDGITSNTTFVIEAKDNSYFLGDILPFLMLSDGFTQHSVMNSKGSTNPYINWSDISNYTFTAPSIDKQKSTLKVLLKFEEVKDLYSDLIESANSLKQRLIRSYYNKESSELSNLGEIKWSKKKIKDLVSINYGKSPKDVISDNGAYPIIGTGGKTGVASSYLVSDSVIIVGRKGTIDNPQLIEEKCWPIDTTFYCIPEIDLSIKWLYYMFTSINWKILNEASGVPSLSKQTFGNIKINIPDINTQSKMVQMLEEMDREIDLLKQQLDTTLKAELAVINRTFI